jgi:hypothetical protein
VTSSSEERDGGGTKEGCGRGKEGDGGERRRGKRGKEGKGDGKMRRGGDEWR